VLAECYVQKGVGRDVDGGYDYARHMLIDAVGERKAGEILERAATNRIAPFEFMEDGDALQIANFLRDEHPQTIAVVLSHLSAQQAANVLSNLGPEIRRDVAMRIGKMDRISPEILGQIEHGLQIKFSSVLTQNYSISGGPDFLGKVLINVDRATEKAIMEHLEETDEALAEEIRSNMFLFEDIVQLDNHSIQTLLAEVDRRDLAVAMKGTSEELKEAIFGNLSTRAQEMLQEEIDLLGGVRLSAVEQTQRKIIDVVRRLEVDGTIFIARGEDEIVS